MQIKTTLDIDAPASAVWQVLGEQFGEVSEWAEAIVRSTMDRPLGQGAVRTCDIKAVGPVPEGQVTEELTQFDREAHALTFVVRSGVPGFMRFVENAWSVESLDAGRSRATSVVTLRLAWWALPVAPMIRLQLGRTLQGFAAQLKTAATASSAGAPLAAAHAN